MIKQITVRNWKSFEEATLYLDPLTVLIGTNASGKSSILDALAFLSRSASGKSLSAALSEIRGGAEWAPRHPETRFEISVAIENPDAVFTYSITTEAKEAEVRLLSERLERTSEGCPPRILIETDDPSEAAPGIRAWHYRNQRGKPPRREYSRSLSILSQVAALAPEKKSEHETLRDARIVAQTLSDVFVLDPIPAHMREYVRKESELKPDARNVAGVMLALPDAERQWIEAKILEYAERLPEGDVQRVWAEPIGKFQSDAMLYCEEVWASTKSVTTVDARGMSDGTLRVLAILTALLVRPEGSLLVVEEVDNGLHPSRAKLLVEMLTEVAEQRSVDVLVTTHNPALLDALGNEMVPFIAVAHRNPDTGLSEITMLDDVERLPKLLAMGSVGKLATNRAIETALAEQAR